MKNLVLSAFLLACLSAGAQSPNNPIRLSEVVDDKNLAVDDFVFGPNGSFMALWRESGLFKNHPDYHFITYDKANMQATREVVIAEPLYKEVKAYYEHSYFNEEGNIVAYFRALDRDGSYLLRTVIDKEGGHSGFEEIVPTTGYKELFVEFELEFSADSTRLLFMATDNHNGPAPQEINLRVEDKNQKLLWRKELELPIKNSDFTIFDQALSNDGVAYVAGYNHATKQIHIYAIGEQGLNETVLPLEKSMVRDVHLLPDYSSQRLGVFGMYGESWNFYNNEDAEGAFIGMVNQDDLALESFKTDPVYRKNLEDFLPEAAKGKDLEDLYLREVVRKPAGGAWLFFETKGSHQGAEGSVSFTDDIIVMSLNSEAKEKWVSAIPQRQAGYASYISNIRGIKGDNIHVIMYEDTENTDDTPIDDFNTYRPGFANEQANIVAYSLNVNGELERTVLRNYDKDALMMHTDVTMSHSENEVLIYFRTMRKKVLGFYQL